MKQTVEYGIRLVTIGAAYCLCASALYHYALYQHIDRRLLRMVAFEDYVNTGTEFLGILSAYILGSIIAFLSFGLLKYSFLRRLKLIDFSAISLKAPFQYEVLNKWRIIRIELHAAFAGLMTAFVLSVLEVFTPQLTAAMWLAVILAEIVALVVYLLVTLDDVEARKRVVISACILLPLSYNLVLGIAVGARLNFVDKPNVRITLLNQGRQEGYFVEHLRSGFVLYDLQKKHIVYIPQEMVRSTEFLD